MINKILQSLLLIDMLLIGTGYAQQAVNAESLVVNSEMTDSSLEQTIKGPIIVLEKAKGFSQKPKGVKERHEWMKQRNKSGIKTYENINFIDQSGNIVKQISLRPDTLEKIRKKDPSGREWDVAVVKDKDFTIAKNNKWVLVNYTTTQNVEMTLELQKEIENDDSELDFTWLSKDKHRLVFYDSTGNNIWEKNIPGVASISMSKDVNYIFVYVITDSIYDPGDNDIHAMFVYDRNGKQLLRLPQKGFSTLGHVVTSPNGRYIGINNYISNNEQTAFYDLVKNKLSIIKEDYGLQVISDMGIAKYVISTYIDKRFKVEHKEIDLNKLFGE